MHKYKKYIVFAWYEHESEGGLSDIQGSFDTKEECQKFKNEWEIWACWNVQVIDRDTWEDITGEFR